MAFVGHRNLPGMKIAEALEGAWREHPPSLMMPLTGLEEIAPRLMRTQEAGLAWRRLPPEHAASLVGRQLAAGFRHVRLRNAVIESALPRLVRALRARGVDPVLVKGWSVARLYPERGLRPYGDVDLVVRVHEEAAARAALAVLAPLEVAVDLHVSLTNEQGIRLLEDDEETVYARSCEVALGDTTVRVLAWEDHLRLVCLHLWRHGAFRPLWFCDVAVTLESLPRGFDWDLCLGRRRPRGDWVANAVELARRLLGARVPDAGPWPLPTWLEPAVLRQWTEFGEAEPRPLATYLRDPRGFYDKLRWRWVNPLWAVQRWQGPLAALPRWRYQVEAFFTPGSRLIRHIPQIEVCAV